MNAQEPEFTSDPARYSDWFSGYLKDSTNVGDVERLASIVGGALLAFYGLRHSPLSALLLLLGGGFAYRGLTGHCHVYQAANISTAPPKKGQAEAKVVAMKPKPSDVVNEASWESFPASDPPSWSGGYT